MLGSHSDPPRQFLAMLGGYTQLNIKNNPYSNLHHYSLISNKLSNFLLFILCPQQHKSDDPPTASKFFQTPFSKQTGNYYILRKFNTAKLPPPADYPRRGVREIGEIWRREEGERDLGTAQNPSPLVLYIIEAIFYSNINRNI